MSKLGEEREDTFVTLIEIRVHLIRGFPAVARFSKVPITFRVRKAICKTANRLIVLESRSFNMFSR